MKNFFTKNGMILLTSLTAIALVLCIVSAASSGTGFVHNALGVIASPFRSIGGAIGTWVDDIGQRFDSLEELRLENETLRKQNAELQEQLRKAKEDSEENERLRTAMGLRLQRRDFVFESAKIVGESSSNWSSTLTLSKGTNFDISVGDCVVNEEGFLVGVVTEAGLNWSTVTTLVDTSSQLGALVFRTGEITVAQGDLALMNRDLLRLSYLESESSLMNGDLIVTSGLGGYYPSGLVIGSVQEIRTDDTGLTKYAILAPQVDLDQLKQVFVITDFQIVE